MTARISSLTALTEQSKGQKPEPEPLPNQVLRKKLERLAVSSSGFIFDPQSGQSFSVNHTALLTLQLLKEGANSQETAQVLSSNYEIPFEIAINCVEGFMLQIGRYL